GAAARSRALARPRPDVAADRAGLRLLDRWARLLRGLRLPPHRPRPAPPRHRDGRGDHGRVHRRTRLHPADRHGAGPPAARRELRPRSLPPRLRRAAAAARDRSRRHAHHPPHPAPPHGRTRPGGPAVARRVALGPLAPALTRRALALIRRVLAQAPALSPLPPSAA